MRINWTPSAPSASGGHSPTQAASGAALWRQTWREIAGQGGDARQAPAELGEGYTPVHEYVYKLDRIPERLFTATARSIAHERRAFMRQFFDRLDREVLGEA